MQSGNHCAHFDAAMKIVAQAGYTAHIIVI